MHVIEKLAHPFPCAPGRVIVHAASLKSTQEISVLGYRLEQLSRFFCALQTTLMHHSIVHAKA